MYGFLFRLWLSICHEMVTDLAVVHQFWREAILLLELGWDFPIYTDLRIIFGFKAVPFRLITPAVQGTTPMACFAVWLQECHEYKYAVIETEKKVREDGDWNKKEVRTKRHAQCCQQLTRKAHTAPEYTWGCQAAPLKMTRNCIIFSKSSRGGS